MYQSSSLALVIPSFNRNSFLERQLNYYSRVDFPYSIYIGDSSNLDNHESLKLICESYGNLQITLVHLPDTNESVAILRLLEIATEEFAVFSGDDDFHLPQALEKGCLFLKKNLDYSVCIGTAQAFVLEGNKDSVQGKIVSLGTYPVYDVNLDEPLQRLKKQFHTYFPTLFGVHRRLQFLKAFSYVEKFEMVTFRELAPVSYDVIKGKVKLLKDLQFFRQGHQGRLFVPKGIHWVLSPGWLDSYRAFEDFVVANVEGLNVMEFRELFSPYFKKAAKWCKSDLKKKQTQNFILKYIRKITLDYRVNLRINRLLQDNQSKELEELFRILQK